MVWAEVGCLGGSKVENILSKACMMVDPTGLEEVDNLKVELIVYNYYELID